MRFLPALCAAPAASMLIGLSACAVEGDDAGAVDGDDVRLDEIEQVNAARDPVIFVHGCSPAEWDDAHSATFFDPMKDYFRSIGYPDSYLVSFVNAGPRCDSNDAFAAELADLVQETLAATGKARVDLVAHSMGALAARLYIAEYGGHSFVRDVVSIAGGNHGGLGASQALVLQAQFGAPAYEGMKEMYPPYACHDLSLGAADVQFELNGCLTTLGRTVARDETPYEPEVAYRAIWNSQDEIAAPGEVGCLDQRWQLDCASPVNVEVTAAPGPGDCPGYPFCPAHVAILWDPDTMAITAQHVTARGPGGG
jgi:triacylglycerol lipase